MITIYQYDHHLNVFEEDSLIEPSHERHAQELAHLSFHTALPSAHEAALTLNQQASGWRACLNLLSGSGIVERASITFRSNKQTHTRYTDDLGGADLDLEQDFTDLLVEWDAPPSIPLFNIQRFALSEESLLEVLLQCDAGIHSLFLPELALRIQFDGTETGFLEAVESIPIQDYEIERGRVVSTRKALKSLRKLGIQIDSSRGKGSHQLAISPTGRQVVIPIHNGDIKKGTLNSILRSLGITYDQLINA